VCFRIVMDIAGEETVVTGSPPVTANRFEMFRRHQAGAATGKGERRPGQEAANLCFMAEVSGSLIQPGSSRQAEPVAGEAAAAEEEEAFQMYGKQFPGLKTPFGLPIECFPIYERMLDANPAAVEQVNVMLKGAVAESTAAGYGSVVARFHNFCTTNGFTFPDFTTEAVINFLQQSMAEGAGLAFFQKVLPSLALLEKVLDVEKTAITAGVQSAAGAIRRERAKTRGIVKKATGFPFPVIEDLIKREVEPYERVPEKIDVFAFRAIMRAVIIYFTFCRFDDYRRLTDADFSDGGSHIRIVFEKSKNDQYGDNSVSVVTERPGCAACPVKLIRLYFRRFGLHFNGSGKLLNFRLRKEAGVYTAMHKYGLSASNATKGMRQLLEKHGYDAGKYTEKSMKVQGVTELLDTGEKLENVMVFGRWRTQTTPLHYRNLSMKFRLGVAKNIPTQ
jgi:hypothetical protein